VAVRTYDWGLLVIHTNSWLRSKKNGGREGDEERSKSRKREGLLASNNKEQYLPKYVASIVLKHVKKQEERQSAI
jgi:hypothetical protein